MILIPLCDRDGGVKAVTMIDDCDSHLAETPWSLNNGGYARSSKGLLHRVIMNATDRLIPVDHHNHDRLDNRRENLRIVTSRINNLNRRKTAGKSSQYLGVTRLEAKRKWGAYIHISCKRTCLGSYETEIEAAQQYDHYVRSHKLDHNVNDVHLPHDLVPFLPPPARDPDDVGLVALKSGAYRAEVCQGKYRRREVFETKAEAVAARANWCKESAQQKLDDRLGRWVVNGSVAQVIVSQTTVTVDAADVQELFLFCWRITSGYAACDALGLMHRYLTRPGPRDIVDHINGNRSDNRRSNLRVVDFSVNNHNRQLRTKGVRQHKCGKYFGVLLHRGKSYTTPLVVSFEQAREARKHYGEHARLQ